MEVAFTVRLVSASSAATVNNPVASMVVSAFLPVSVIDQVTVCEGLPVPATTAANDWVAPLATLALGGLTVTLSTVIVEVVPPPPSVPISQPTSVIPNASTMLNIAAKTSLFFILKLLLYEFSYTLESSPLKLPTHKGRF
ncbi:hypothetical protein AGMMS49942_24940 [Spirochaetia bacterium]|nr:hypothetical protein AGMMS49942_24940 [Spirochaetia bacterium]